MKCKICNFGDDNDLYSCGMTLENIFSYLKNDMKNIHQRFAYNSIKANPDQFQFTILIDL